VKDKMKKFTRIAVIFIVVALLFALASPSPVMASPLWIEEPSFETVVNWTFSETDNDYVGAQSGAWTTQGANSYLISIAGKNIVNGRYAQILQSVDFTSIDTFSFDAYLQADTALEFEARVLVGTTTVWGPQAVPIAATEYLHQEVDVSTYTGTQDLIFRIVDLVGAKSATISCYFDNIKTLGSYSNSLRTTVSNDFTTYGDTVYIYGENFDTTGTYKVAYYDGGTAHDGADGAKVETDTYTDDPDGILDESQCRPADYETSSYGTWHAVVYKTTETMPTSYDLVSTGDAAYVVTDSFTVQQAAIPEFPTVMAAIGVAGLCCGIYFWMRKRYRRVEVRI